MKKKSKKRLKVSFWLTLFAGIIFSIFIWITWKKLTEWLGDGWLVWGITGGIVLLAIFLGYFSFNKIIKGFVN